MEENEILNFIRNELFYGPADYTKNQPDIFISHRFKILAPSQTDSFLEKVKESLTGEEILFYVHLPFCFSECLFCNSFPHKAEKEAELISCLSGHGCLQQGVPQAVPLNVQGGVRVTFPTAIGTK
jgi:hypothetical protein